MAGSMTRLQRHQNKIFINQIVLYLVIFGLIIVFISTIGFRLLISSSLFVNQLVSKNNGSTVSNNNQEFFGNFTVDPLIEATNSAKIMVSGSVNRYNKIIFYLNDDKVKEITPQGDTYSEEIDNLQKGDNKIYLVAKEEKLKKEKKSDNFIVSFKNDKPKLEITSPQDNAKVSQTDVNITGKTDVNITIKVNNLPVLVDTLGNFQTQYHLKEGDNKLEFVAEDDFGNTETKTITVNYQKDN
jgi:hypothetical protein